MLNPSKCIPTRFEAGRMELFFHEINAEDRTLIAFNNRFNGYERYSIRKCNLRGKKALDLSCILSSE
jgi:hypothetical protein